MPAALKIGAAMWVGDVANGKPHGQGDLILPNGSVHRGGFVEGRASGPGVLYDATGAVLTGSWLESKRVGAFVTIDPKGGEWADTYDASGTRTSRKKSAPAPADGAGAAQKCRHCAVKFHGAHNSSCRQHSGKWLTASEVASDAVDAEYPEGGMWLCCGSKKRVGDGCGIGVHATVDAAAADGAGELRLRRDEKGEVVIDDVGAKPASKAVPGRLPADWRERARDSILNDAPFRSEGGLVWLDVGRSASLAPLASLAECGRTGCACTRNLYPRVRQRWREEIARRAAAARDAGMLPADGRISYASYGSGRLLTDLDVVCALQAAGFVVEAAALIDLEYGGDGGGGAPLAAFAQYLAPDGRATPFASAADYAAARLQGRQPAAHIFVQCDADEITEDDAIALSAVALADGGGLGFRLYNHHHPTEVPMVAWRRCQPSAAARTASLLRELRFGDEEARQVAEKTEEEADDEEATASGAAPAAAEEIDAAAAYRAVLKKLDLPSLIERDDAPIVY